MVEAEPGALTFELTRDQDYASLKTTYYLARF